MSKPQNLGEAGDRCPRCGGKLILDGPVGWDIWEDGEEDQFEEECVSCRNSRLVYVRCEFDKPDRTVFGKFTSERKAQE